MTPAREYRKGVAQSHDHHRLQTCQDKREGTEKVSSPGCERRQTNGFLEALNGLFQSAKRRACGYGRFSTIRTVIFLIARKLDFSSFNPHAA